MAQLWIQHILLWTSSVVNYISNLSLFQCKNSVHWNDLIRSELLKCWFMLLISDCSSSSFIVPPLMMQKGSCKAFKHLCQQQQCTTYCWWEHDNETVIDLSNVRNWIVVTLNHPLPISHIEILSSTLCALNRTHMFSQFAILPFCNHLVYTIAFPNPRHYT